MASRPVSDSYWNATAESTGFPRLSGDVEVDVAVIGGGIVGLTCARLLKDRGQRVAVIEARRVGRQVTGKSTAKITSQHGLKYAELARKFSEDQARLYAEAQEAGINTIREMSTRHAIACDIETQPAYAYTTEQVRVSAIEEEAEMARRLGLPATLTRETGLPFEVLAAMRFDGQAQFHPVKYLAGLAATIPGDGSHVFEDSRVIDYEPTRAVTDHGCVTARVVVMATHLPLGQVGGYYAQVSPKAEPAVAARVDRVPEGMFIDVGSTTHSIRTHRGADGETYAVAIGNHFKPGQPDQERDAIEGIERWLRDNFGAREIAYRWINEDYVPMDGAPFVGWSKSVGDGYLVATGFNAWGISGGTAAATILADLATERDNPWLEIFDARRVKPVAGGKEFLRANVAVAKHLIGGYLEEKPEAFDELAPGEAKILKIDGDNIAAFRDEQGALHAVSAVCSHMGCLVGWNETDRSWDCPCHGSRFSLTGEVMHGPATRPLGSGVTG